MIMKGKVRHSFQVSSFGHSKDLKAFIWTCVVEEMLTYGNRLRSTHCRKFLTNMPGLDFP